MKTVLIAGATGYLGRNIVQHDLDMVGQTHGVKHLRDHFIGLARQDTETSRRHTLPEGQFNIAR